MLTLELVGLHVEVAGRSVPLVTLIDDWCARVLKLAQDSRRRDDEPHAWTLHDLAGAYIIRNQLNDALMRYGSKRDAIEVPTVSAADALLRSFSVEDGNRVVAELEPEEDHQGWWWSLVPRYGPIAAELGLL